jgi:hypothetical protein
MQQLVEEQSPKEPLREESPNPSLDREGGLDFNKSLKRCKIVQAQENFTELNI